MHDQTAASLLTAGRVPVNGGQTEPSSSCRSHGEGAAAGPGHERKRFGELHHKTALAEHGIGIADDLIFHRRHLETGIVNAVADHTSPSARPVRGKRAGPAGSFPDWTRGD